MLTTQAPTPKAVLVGVQLQSVSDVEHAADLAELARLVQTLGYEVVATVSQKRAGLASGTVLGKGKLKELAQLTGGTGEIPSSAKDTKSKAKEAWEAEEEEDADAEDEPAAVIDQAALEQRATVVVVDHELSPNQARNLEKATGAQVLDRTGVIVDIFHRHAKSREARAQVEIARLTYVAPRLRESTGGTERQQGRGAGESALELDRRKIRDRIAELKEQLATIHADQDQRRYARRDQLRVALVGYTNAGKSSLMRALTGSEVLVADRLFATLDTTVRALQPETHPRILVSDTVGFIKKLPHDLVASFKSTLDEALEASLLLLVVDGSDATWQAQLEVTQGVLEEIGAGPVPRLMLFNKADRLDAATKAALAKDHPDAVVLSAHAPADVAALRKRLIDSFETSMVEGELVIPYAKQAVVSQVYENARVVSETFDESGRRMVVRALPGAMARLTRLVSG
ncbi:MAG: GTPase HflX [Myxococcales bacterium]|nr:GTPase HflX [Myxococcales bacterium]